VTRLTVATCQFPVSDSVDENLGWIERQLRFAAAQGADVAHFPEGALSGYAGVSFDSFDGFDWNHLELATRQLMDLAADLRIWLVLGSSHRLSGGHRPHNCLYVISDRGEVVDRYDKRFCSGDMAAATGDLAHYSPGSHRSVWEIRGVRCGALICYDYRFPELYRDYKQHGVDVMFHAFHAANVAPERLESMKLAIGPELQGLNTAATFTYPGITMPAAMVSAAAQNHVWISCSNSSARESLWPAFFVRADGITTGRLSRNEADVLITEVDTEAKIYDSTIAWRGRAITGKLHSGSLVDDSRSRDRTTF
jgi:deaminated glutathione amidase